MADTATGGYFSSESTTMAPNFLGGEVGLITKTCQVPAALGVQDGSRKYVAGGTILPANDATAKGVLLQDEDVTDGDRIGSMITSGHLLGNMLPTVPSAAAVTALQAQGLYFDDMTASGGTTSGSSSTGGK
ncbi:MULTISPECIES: hypothetical protein [Caproicibacterium]|uniref:Head decoration protein n=1 Tax=Caproicibacterium argilliputei TaxID=3030016 RepID=A0AA97DAU4_9FIRM|nr:hypothetical protein [Caproicibacterium argilliputei]WOC32817.1 hypothetical protein PXC00_02780 [Caproicibacterium argilliputei]